MIDLRGSRYPMGDKQHDASRKILEPLRHAQKSALTTARIKKQHYELLAGKGNEPAELVAAARLEMKQAELAMHRATLELCVEGLRAAEALIPLHQVALEKARAVGVPVFIERRERARDSAVRLAQKSQVLRQQAIADVERLTAELDG